MSCLPPPPAELTFCDPAKPGTLPSAGFPGLPDMGTQNCKSSQPARPHLTDSSSFLLQIHLLQKIKPLSRNTGTGGGRYWPGADGSPERLRAVSSKGPIVPHSSSEMLSQGPWGLSLPWDQTDTCILRKYN